MARRGSGRLTHAALVVVQLSFAGGAVEGKLAMRPVEAAGGGVEPIALAMARIAGAALFFQVFFQVVARLGSRRIDLPGRDHARVAGLAMLGIVLNQTLFLVGLRITTVVAAALLGATNPGVHGRARRPAPGGVDERAHRCRSRSRWQASFGRPASARGGGRHRRQLHVVRALHSPSRARSCDGWARSLLVTWLFAWGAVLLAPLGAWPLAHGTATKRPRGGSSPASWSRSRRSWHT
ncbi:MAG: hypothetical protein ACRELB_01020 [Polyangiaceae bacterium]